MLAALTEVRYVNYRKYDFFDGKDVMADFRSKLSVMSINTTSHLSDTCTALFTSQFTTFEWQHIECNEILSNNHFICEIGTLQSKNDTHLRSHYVYSRGRLYCPISNTYVKGACWSIKASNIIFSSPYIFEYQSLKPLLTYWSYGNENKSKILYLVTMDKYFCLVTYAFKTQLIKHWQLKECAPTSVDFILQQTAPLSAVENLKCHNARYFACDGNTCLLNIYVCDGIAHCVDKSDEDMCSNICSLQSHACYRTCVAVTCICEDTYFQCHFGGCIPMSTTCNGVMNCDDGSD